MSERQLAEGWRWVDPLEVRETGRWRVVRNMETTTMHFEGEAPPEAWAKAEPEPKRTCGNCGHEKDGIDSICPVCLTSASVLPRWIPKPAPVPPRPESKFFSGTRIYCEPVEGDS